MRDVLPQEVLDAIGDQYRKAVKLTARSYGGLHGNEDHVTGGLVINMRQDVRGSLTTSNGESYRWTTVSSKTIRGIAPGAPEHRIGADFILEVEVTKGGEQIAQKAVLVQAKNHWQGTDPRLTRQAERMTKLPGKGLVVDYRHDGFRSCTADAALAAEGNRERVGDALKDFGDALAVDFLPCKVGARDLHYDADEEALYTRDPATGTLSLVRFPVKRRIRTRITRTRIRRRSGPVRW